ncbi:MAG: hypothetical protein KC593_19665 [Myxococcales bacterium]|nr:hypothetical protein [Myxococcales bacterium]
MKHLIALLLALAVLPTAQASAQAAWPDETAAGRDHSESNLSLAIGVTSLVSGSISLGHGSRLVLGMGGPLVALGAADIVLGIVQRGADAPSGPVFEQRLRSARVGLLVGGGALASIGAYVGSDFSIGAGVALAGHSAFRLLAALLTPHGATQPPRFEVGVTVLPSPYGRVTTATLGGVL